MADEMIAPLMGNNDRQEEERNRDDEISPLLKNNNKIKKNENLEYIQNSNSNREININLNDNEIISLIFLSFAIQILIYFFLFRYFNDKDNFIKQHINIFFALSLLIILFIIIIHFYYFSNRISPIYLILITLVSTFGLFCFLYKICVVYTFDLLKYTFLIISSMYLNTSIYFFCTDEITIFALLTNNILPFLFSSIFFFGDFEFFILNIALSFILGCLSIAHISILVKEKHCKIKDYPIFNMGLSIEIFGIVTYSVLVFFLKKYGPKSRNYRRSQSNIKNKPRYNKPGNLKNIMITPYDAFHPNESKKEF